MALHAPPHASGPLTSWSFITQAGQRKIHCVCSTASLAAPGSLVKSLCIQGIFHSPGAVTQCGAYVKAPKPPAGMLIQQQALHLLWASYIPPPLRESQVAIRRVRSLSSDVVHVQKQAVPAFADWLLSRDSTAIIEGQHRLCRKDCELRGRRDYQHRCPPHRFRRVIAQQLQVWAAHNQPLIGRRYLQAAIKHAIFPSGSTIL